MSTVHEQDLTGLPSTALAAKNGEDYWAAAVDNVASGLEPKIPVDLTSSTAATDEVIGEFLHSEFDGKEARIRTTGFMYMRAKSAYQASDNGKGVEASDTAGLVQPSSAVGGGFGKITGGATINIDGTDVHILQVYR